ncbi:MAG: T7SS effector LXG polymorphic toxin [Sporolactobacillus sp.]
MRAVMGSSGTAANTICYEAKSLIRAAEARAQQYQTLGEEMRQLKQSFAQITALGPSFKGRGAEKIMAFYQAQETVVNAWLRLIEKQVAFLNGIAGEIDDRNLGGATQVQIPFLESDLSIAYWRSRDVVNDQKESINKVLNSISDLIPVGKLNTEDVDHQLDQANRVQTKMSEDVRDLDRTLLNEYQQVISDVPQIVSLYSALENATRQGADVEPLHFNAEIFYHSDAYKIQGDLEKQTTAYLSFKKQQEQARQVSKKEEEAVNRPWYEKAELKKANHIYGQVYAGIYMGLYDTVKDTVVGLWQMITSPPEQVAGDLARAVIHPQQTYAIIKNAIVQSYDKKMVQGNVYTRSQWITYAVAMIALSFLGTKGIDKVGKAVDVGKLAEKANQAGTFTKNLFTDKINNFQGPLAPKFQFTGGNVPYNTFDAKGLKAKLLSIADSTSDSSQIKQLRSSIQQTSMSTKKIYGLSEQKGIGFEKVSGAERFINSISDLKHTNNFRTGALEHILEGELNARGKAVGYHSESIDGSIGHIIKGTESHANKFGVYKAKVEVNGIPKISNGGKSNLFPKNWDAQKVTNSINEAFENKVLIKGNTYSGKLKNGMEINMYIDKSGKIISAFPVY